MSRGGGRAIPRRLAAARLAAVQALYQIELTGASADQAIRDILEHGIAAAALVPAPDDPQAEIEERLAAPDADLFADIVRGTLARQSDLDKMVGDTLTGGWTVERLETVLRAILRAAAYELAARADIPPKSAISAYVDVAHSFYAGAEPGLVNAVLDRIAYALRAVEMGGDASA